MLLLLAGAALLAAAAWLARQAPGQWRPGTPAAPAVTPLALAQGTPAALRLGPTAQAAATRLPPATPIPSAGPPSPRPAAPVRIVIPALGIDARVVEVGWHVRTAEGGAARGEWDTVAGAVGHHRGSADPGQSGNCVLSGHSSDAGGLALGRLSELAQGDGIELYSASGQRFDYVATTSVLLDEVSASAAEKRQHAAWLDPTDEPVLTLVTCWPVWSYTHRLVLRADLRAQ